MRRLVSDDYVLVPCAIYYTQILDMKASSTRSAVVTECLAYPCAVHTETDQESHLAHAVHSLGWWSSTRESKHFCWVRTLNRTAEKEKHGLVLLCSVPALRVDWQRMSRTARELHKDCVGGALPRPISKAEAHIRRPMSGHDGSHG